MKKIININLSGRVIPIEDSAYESLQRYIESLRKYFANEEGRDEIINDIESRIAELMSDKIKKGAPVVTESDIDEIIHSMGRVQDFEAAGTEESKTSTATSSPNFTIGSEEYSANKPKGRLYRNASDKLIGGVCSGVANYLNLDPTFVRFFFAIITFGGFGIGFLIYILLWILLPVKNLDTYTGKRLFRNPDDRVIAGVAGGISAFTNFQAKYIRLIFAAPLIINILFGAFHAFFLPWHNNIFYPNIFFGSFTGTFIFIYIILWIVLPEAKSSFEKMEMRGEKVDVGSIRQNVKVEIDNMKKNVQDEVKNFTSRTESWAQEVKETAQQFSTRATEFANTRGKSFASEVSTGATNVGKGLGHIIGVLFRAFFIFVAGCMTLTLLGFLIVIIFGGVAWWPINDFLWSSGTQKFLAWSTIILFITVPVIGFMTWLVRRIFRVRSRNSYLGWTFGGLWTLGWICAILFAVSITKDLRVYDRTVTEIPITQPSNEKLIVKVNEPVIHYNGSGWIKDEGSFGWDINGDTMKYNFARIRVKKSSDTLYHVRLYKYSAGQSTADAQNRADRTQFHISSNDSILNIGSGMAIDKESKFRGQGIIMEIDIPEGKEIRFDESLRYAYDYNVVRKYDPHIRFWGQRYSYKEEWNEDNFLNWAENIDYVMTSDGKLIMANEAITTKKGIYQTQTNEDSLQHMIEERKKQNDLDAKKLEEIRIEHQKQNEIEIHKLEDLRKKKNESTGALEKEENENMAAFTQLRQPFAPLII